MMRRAEQSAHASRTRGGAVIWGVGAVQDVAGAEFSSGTGSGCRQGVDASIFGAVRLSH
jgi:hypothetical protein